MFEVNPTNSMRSHYRNPLTPQEIVKLMHYPMRIRNSSMRQFYWVLWKTEGFLLDYFFIPKKIRAMGPIHYLSLFHFIWAVGSCFARQPRWMVYEVRHTWFAYKVYWIQLYENAQLYEVIQYLREFNVPLQVQYALQASHYMGRSNWNYWRAGANKVTETVRADELQYFNESSQPLLFNVSLLMAPKTKDKFSVQPLV